MSTVTVTLMGERPEVLQVITHLLPFELPEEITTIASEKETPMADDSALIIGLSVGIPVAFILIVVMLWYAMRRGRVAPSGGGTPINPMGGTNTGMGPGAARRLGIEQPRRVVEMRMKRSDAWSGSSSHSY